MHRDAEASGPHYSTLPRDAEERLGAGQVLLDGRIEVVAELARGGMAVVYKAKDRANGGKLVALKVVTAETIGDDTEGRYLNEARLGASLASDRQFAAALEVGRLQAPPAFAGRMFLVSELVDAPSLDRVMARHRRGMPAEQVVRIARLVAQALVSLHERGIVHRDIKPGNVIVEGEEARPQGVRIIDFGLAYATGDGWEPQSPDLTREGHAPGTPLYMSPQQIVHERPTPAFDIYSFGAMCYELISGHPPYEGVALEVLISDKCDPLRKPFPIAKMRPSTPEHVAALVDRCLSYDPAQRPTAREIVDVLEGRPSRREPDAGPSLRIVREPSVVAQGARPAGPATRAALEIKAIALPSVERARRERVQASPAAPRGPDRVPPPEPATSDAGPSASEELTAPVPATWKRWGLVAALVVAAVVGASVAAGMLGTDGESAPSTKEPSNDSSAVAEPIPVSPRSDDAEPKQPAGDSPERLPATAEAEHPVDAATTDAEASDPPEPDGPPPTNVTPPVNPPQTPEKKKSQSAPRAKPHVDPDTSHDEPACDGVVDDASAAQRSAEWAKVLRLTKRGACWTEAPALRVQLRTQALLEQGQYDECVRVGSGSSDAAVRRTVGICKGKKASAG